MTPEQNRLLAEWLEPMPVEWDEHGYVSPIGAWICHNPSSNVKPGEFEWKPADFLHDEAANAMLLEKMPRASLQFFKDSNVWACMSDFCAYDEPVEHPDRKHAIVLAALALIEKGKS